MKKNTVILIFLFTPLLSQFTLLEEAGYVLAMEAKFETMSYLSMQDEYYGHYAIGGFDPFMAYSGFMQALARHQEVPEYKGIFLVATGF